MGCPGVVGGAAPRLWVGNTLTLGFPPASCCSVSNRFWSRVGQEVSLKCCVFSAALSDASPCPASSQRALPQPLFALVLTMKLLLAWGPLGVLGMCQFRQLCRGEEPGGALPVPGAAPGASFLLPTETWVFSFPPEMFVFWPKLCNRLSHSMLLCNKMNNQLSLIHI